MRTTKKSLCASFSLVPFFWSFASWIQAHQATGQAKWNKSKSFFVKQVLKSTFVYRCAGSLALIGEESP